MCERAPSKVEKHVDFCLHVLGLVLVLAARSRTRVNVNPLY